MELIKKGIYKHFKGGKYRVLGVAKHSETKEELVVYQNINSGELWVRPVEIFVGGVEVDGKMVKRFKFEAVKL